MSDPDAVAAMSAVTAALLAFIWQGAGIGVLLAAMLAIIPERSARLRYVASAIAMGTLALLPAVASTLVYSSRGAWVVATVPPVAALAPAVGREIAATIQRWLVLAWLCGVAIASIRLAIGWRHVRRIRLCALDAPPGIAEVLTRVEAKLEMPVAARLGLTDMTESPVVFGASRPMILLPVATIAELTREQLETVLAHELAHVRRRDFAVNLAQLLVETLLFFHPATWWVSSRMRVERERCCDDSAVALSGDPATYVRALLTLERSRPAAPSLMLGLGAGAHELLPRIRRIMRVERPMVRAATASVAIAGFLLVAGAGTALSDGCRNAALYQTERSARANQLPIPVKACATSK
jgi:beta-lactamase regulating signal transducer with metallopeptidase domain